MSTPSVGDGRYGRSVATGAVRTLAVARPWADRGRTAEPGSLSGMGELERPITVALPTGICRRCVRALSRRISDVPGVRSLEYDASGGVLRVGGAPDLAALRALGLPVASASG